MSMIPNSSYALSLHNFIRSLLQTITPSDRMDTDIVYSYGLVFKRVMSCVQQVFNFITSFESLYLTYQT
jgi:hypothetical protein